MTVLQLQLPNHRAPLVTFSEIDLATAESCLVEWRHPLHLDGERFTRPFGRACYLMEERGRPAAVVVLASTINASVAKDRGLHRYNTVDLARIARSPDRRDRHCLRAVLRITREYLAPRWLGRYARWDERSAELCGKPTIAALCSTSLPGTPGGMYRFDGFTQLRVSTGPKGGGHQRASVANRIADGARGLWAYQYPEPIR